MGQSDQPRRPAREPPPARCAYRFVSASVRLECGRVKRVRVAYSPGVPVPQRGDPMHRETILLQSRIDAEVEATGAAERAFVSEMICEGEDDDGERHAPRGAAVALFVDRERSSLSELQAAPVAPPAPLQLAAPATPPRPRAEAMARRSPARDEPESEQQFELEL